MIVIALAFTSALGFGIGVVSGISAINERLKPTQRPPYDQPIRVHVATCGLALFVAALSVARLLPLLGGRQVSLVDVAILGIDLFFLWAYRRTFPVPNSDTR